MRVKELRNYFPRAALFGVLAEEKAMLAETKETQRSDCRVVIEGSAALAATRRS